MNEELLDIIRDYIADAREIQETEQKLTDMVMDLTGDEFAIKALLWYFLKKTGRSK